MYVWKRTREAKTSTQAKRLKHRRKKNAARTPEPRSTHPRFPSTRATTSTSASSSPHRQIVPPPHPIATHARKLPPPRHAATAARQRAHTANSPVAHASALCMRLASYRRSEPPRATEPPSRAPQLSSVMFRSRHSIAAMSVARAVGACSSDSNVVAHRASLYLALGSCSRRSLRISLLVWGTRLPLELSTRWRGLGLRRRLARALAAVLRVAREFAVALA